MITTAYSALIVEDHPLYRDALLQLLSNALAGAEVAVANSAEEGLRRARGLSALKIVLLDPGLPGISGTEAIAAFRTAVPNAVIIAVSASDERRDAMAALRAGARLFVSKAVGTDVLESIVRRVLSGAILEPEWITPSGNSFVELQGEALLTPRQQEILQLLAQGYANKEIGLRLELAEVTVKMHVSAIFRALEVANRTQAVRAAQFLGLL